ncbi:hypothetical protein FQZ97_1093560 [compost metagenome]
MIVDDQDRSCRVIQRVDDLGHAPTIIDRIDHGIRPGHRQVVLDVALGIEGKHGHALATGDAQLLQGTGQARNAIAELGIGDTTALGTDGGGVGAPLQMAVQALGDVHGNLHSCCAG